MLDLAMREKNKAIKTEKIASLDLQLDGITLFSKKK